MKAPTKNNAAPAPPVEDETKIIGYARVSTRDQDPEMQIRALVEAGVPRENIYQETVSGASTRRPKFDAMMKDAREGDTIVFWKLDRLGRTVRGVLDTFARLDAKGAKIKCLTQSIDTSNAMGRLVVTILAAVSEMERELGLERTRAGLDRAKAEGRLGGSVARHSDAAILEFASRGIRPGAKAAKMSVSGFQKALIRARKAKEAQRAKRKRKAWDDAATTHQSHPTIHE